MSKYVIAEPSALAREKTRSLNSNSHIRDHRRDRLVLHDGLALGLKGVSNGQEMHE